MQQHGVVHPGLLAKLQPNFYPSLCTIAIPSTVQDEFGQETAILTPVAGMINIPCRVTPRGVNEVRQVEQIYSEATHHVALNGYYPGIENTMAAQIDGVTYDIEGPPQHDGNQKTTRVYLRLVL